MDQLQFSLPEVLSLFGVAQCVYVLVYMIFRAGRISRAGLPMLYFLVLGGAFMTSFIEAVIGELSPYYFYFQWALWFAGPPISVLLVIQIAQITQTPAFRHYWVLTLLPAAFAVSLLLVSGQENCTEFLPCQPLQEWLIVSGLCAGAISLLTIWFNRDIFATIHTEKMGKERYWLILALVLMNIVFLLVVLISLRPEITAEQAGLMRMILGLGLVYLVSTSLFRIYPQAVLVLSPEKNEALNTQDLEIAGKVERFLAFEKVYQEPTYSRADLAKECSTSEAILSRIINVYFGKSFPQLLNEHRIMDAKRLLVETKANVKTVGEEVGFNSLASFNRVFKDMSGVSPSEYRKNKGK